MGRKSPALKKLRGVDALTREWIRDAADERAALAGARMDLARGQHVIDFALANLRLWEGELAGQPLVPHDWQIEATIRLFGWVIASDRWQREIRRFRRASIWIPKKNKKTPTLAWWGLYLFCADGEMGQRVYCVAKNGDQARLSANHAWQMAKASPQIDAQCSYNKNTMQLTHEPTRSILLPLSSADSRTQQAKEGINGSIICDEAHVVDRDFMRIVERAGISRSEPLHIEVSTAGDDMFSYGREQYERGKQIAAGKVADDRTLVICYEAPQKVTDETLDKNIVKYGRQANPAWGHTIDEAEFVDDFQRSRPIPTSWAKFKQYRLNIWQKAANPWLVDEKWQACADATLALESCRDRECWLGLDKSKTRDLTALVAVFREGEGDAAQYWLWPILWLPQATAEEQASQVPWLEWAAAGHLRLIPGEVITDGPIVDAARELSALCRVAGIYYDRTFAHDVTLRMEEELGIPRIEFPQTTQHFAGPIEDFERLVIEGRLSHPANPCLDWQAGHAEVHQDSKGRKTLVKPEHGNLKKIDGLVAAVMGLFGATSGLSAAGSFYDDHELESG